MELWFGVQTRTDANRGGLGLLSRGTAMEEGLGRQIAMEERPPAADGSRQRRRSAVGDGGRR